VSIEGKRAIIIDDDDLNVEILRNMLAKLGVESTRVDNNADVSELLSNLPDADIVFLDLEMPGKSGYDVLHSLHGSGWTKAIPVVAYTTHISHVQEAQSAGFHSFLGKPLRRAEFREQVEQILSGQSVWDLT
jgi:CheY-like chemotaxis protein